MGTAFTAIGVDGCLGGWFFIALKPNSAPPDSGVVCTIKELVQGAGESDRIFVDIPIGLPRGAEERQCDLAARKVLGRPRASSVFRAPTRSVFHARDYEEANQRSRCAAGVGLSKQTFAIVPKIRQVDELLREDEKARRLVREVHPEICFWALNGRKPMNHKKKGKAGFHERKEVLKRVRPAAGREIEQILRRFKRKEVGRDDVADAMVAAVTALADTAALKTLPSHPTCDCAGLPMEMVFRGRAPGCDTTS